MSENVWRVYITASGGVGETPNSYQYITQEAEPTVSALGAPIDTNKTVKTVTRFSLDTIRANTISERTAASGVTVDGVLLKDNDITTSGNIQGNGTLVADTITELTTSGGVTINGSGGLIVSDTLYTDTISEKTAAVGVTIDSVLIKDNTVLCKPAYTASIHWATSMSVTGGGGFKKFVPTGASTVAFDTSPSGGMASTSADAITIIRTGRYFIRTRVVYAASSAKRWVGNGTSSTVKQIIGAVPGSSTCLGHECCAIYDDATTGDEIFMWVFIGTTTSTATGTNDLISPRVQVVYLGDV